MDSDASILTGETSFVELKSGDNNLTLDAGLYKPTGLGNYVWLDNNANGIQDSNETGVAGVRVHLLNSLGVVIKTTLTNETGYYSFDDLNSGSYGIRFVKPAEYVFTISNVRLDDEVDSDADADEASGITDSVILVAGDYNPTLDAGMYKPATLGDFVWHDKNYDGIQDEDENGIQSVRVILTDAEGNGTEIFTDENGKYLFDNLLGGKYTITIDETTLPEKTEETYELDGTLDNTVEVELQHGELKDDVDFGYAQKSSIGDYVWLDSNGDGLQDEDESGIANVIVTLIDVDGNMMLTETDEEGKYIFEDLAAGKYTIEVNENTLPADLNQTYELDGSLNDTVEVDLAQGEIKDDVDFGYSELIDIPEEDIPFGSGEFLPKTGSPIDLVTMMIIGLLMLLVGAVVIIFVNKKTSKKNRRKT